MTSFPKLPVVTVGGRLDLNRAAGQQNSGLDKELPKKNLQQGSTGTLGR